MLKKLEYLYFTAGEILAKHPETTMLMYEYLQCFIIFQTGFQYPQMALAYIRHF